MKTSFVVGAVLAAVMLAPAIAADAPAGPSGVKRTELQRWDVPGSPYTNIVVAVEVEPNAGLPLHTHPGAEIDYITAGTILVSIPGQPDKTYKAGDSFKVEPGIPHSGKNVGTVPYKALSIFVVEKDKPLVIPVK